jgi:superoxide dismutase, Fe-Mn family
MNMYELPKLDYEYDALEPFIDAQTMKIHHTKHHQAYLDKFSDAIKGTEMEGKKVDEILQSIDKVPEKIRTVVRNHGGGYSNHNFFWKAIGKVGLEPREKFMKVAEEMGGMEKLKEDFNAAAMGRFGSGWAWLVVKGNKYEIISTANQDSPWMEGKKPVLGVDVWEHAYYLKYQNKRQEYLDAFWKVINWDFVEKQIE